MRIVALLLCALMPWAVSADPLRTDYLNSQLISQSTTAVPGGLLMLGLWLEHDAGWHTYWQNPGDSGLPTRMTIEVGGEAQQADFLWPLPERFPLDEQLVNFGYKGRVVLPLVVQLPADLEGESLSISARASWLVCEEACIPGSGEYRMTLPVEPVSRTDRRWQHDFDQAARRQPRQAAGASFRVENQHVVLSIPRAAVPGHPRHWTFFPITPEVVRNSREPQWRRQGRDWVAVLERNEFFTAAPPQFDWLLVRGDDGVQVSAPQARD